MITNSEIQKKVINKNIILYTNIEKSIHLELIEKPTSEQILWYQSLRCHLLSTENKITASTHDNKTTISTLQVPALLLKKIGLLNNVNLVDDNQNLVTIETFFASDINAVLQTPNIQSIDGVYNSSFRTLFPKSEGWISKKIAPYLKTLYELIYDQLDKDYLAAFKEKNPLATIRVINNERYKKYEENLNRENQIKKQKSKLRNPHSNDSPDLIDTLLQPKSNYESYDIESYVGSIIALLILLRKYHLQHLETQIQKKISNNTHTISLDECIYNVENVKKGKISIQKILDAYLQNSAKHTNLGEQFHAILLFNNAITTTQEFSTLLLLARVETSFITPLNIVKNFIFFNKDSWSALPSQQSSLGHGPEGNVSMNFGKLIFTQNWRWSDFKFWPPKTISDSNSELGYRPGDWSELIESSYISRLYPLFSHNNNDSSVNISFIINRFRILTDCLTILSIYPYEYGLEQMPDITKSFYKHDEKNQFWLLRNRFSTVIAKLELTRAYQKELNYINTVKQLQPLIDVSYLELTKLLKKQNISTKPKNVYINLSNFTCSNNRKLARYITNETDNTTIKDFINFLNLHKRHISYYIIDTINTTRTYTPSNDMNVQFKQAYLISLKLLYFIYQISPRKFTSANQNNINENINNKIYKNILFPSSNSSIQTNILMKTLKNFLFEPIITTILFSTEPQHYFYKPFGTKLEQYKDFVSYLYESSLITIENNLIRKF